MHNLRPFAPRLLAGFGTLTLLAGIGLFASRPAHTAGGPVPVAITNAPLAVVNSPADVAAPTQPFQWTFQPGSDTLVTASESITVPLHKRLVIEYVSASLNQFSPGIGGYVYLDTIAGGNEVSYRVTNEIQDFNKHNQTLRIYADPGTTVTIGAYSNDFSTPSIGTDTEISGYYVNVP